MKLFVFDIDDTITKSESQHITSYVETMKDFGITNIDQNWAAYRHHTDSYILKENYENNNLGVFDLNMIPDFEAVMTSKILKLNPVSEIAGAGNMIHHLLSNPDYAYSFATGSLLEPAYVKLTQSQIPFKKNQVAAANAIYEREGIVQKSIAMAKAFYNVSSFEQIISVGDGIWDLNTANNLGIHFIGIGMKNIGDFEQAGIRYHITDWTNFDFEHAEKILGISQ